MKTMFDSALGEMSYDYGWTKNHAIRLFGEIANVKLVVPCEENDEIEDCQRVAFLNFEKNKDLFIHQAEVAIFKYYLSICDEYRQKLSAGSAAKMVPLIERKEQLKSLIHADQLLIQQSFGSGERVVGLLFTCSWEPELGLAVKFVDEEIEEVGPQDIVL